MKHDGNSDVYAPEIDRGVFGRCPGVSLVHEDHTGAFWVGTFNAGIFRHSDVDEKPQYIQYNPGNSRSLSDNAIDSIFEDRQGRVWIGTWHGGLNMYDPYAVNLAYKSPIDRPTGNDKAVMSLHEDRDGNLMAGALRGGINLLEPGEHQSTALRRLIDGTRYNHSWVIGLWHSQNNNYWISAAEEGLARINASGDIENITEIVYNGIGWLSEFDNNLWLSTWGSGLHKLDLSTGKIQSFSAAPDVEGSISSNNVGSMLHDSMKRSWIATTNGINLFNPKSETFTSYLKGNLFMSNISEDREGKLWVGSTSNGLFHFDPETGDSTHYSFADGLPSNAITCT